ILPAGARAGAGHRHGRAAHWSRGKRESGVASNRPPGCHRHLRAFCAGRLSEERWRTFGRLPSSIGTIQVLMKTHLRKALIRSTVVLVAVAITEGFPANDRDRQAQVETF